MANKIPPLQDMYYLDINIYKNIKYQMKMNFSKIDISGMPLNFVLPKMIHFYIVTSQFSTISDVLFSGIKFMNGT